MSTVRCWFQSPQSIHCWKHYNSLFVCYWLFPPTFSFLKHLPFMNAASWAWKQFLMDAWDGFFSYNFACTHYTQTVHIDKNNLWSAYCNGFHILIMLCSNDMTLTHLSLLSLRWDWYWFQAWSAHDTRKMNNIVPLLNCCKLWVQWSGHLFKDLPMHLRKLQQLQICVLAWILHHLSCNQEYHSSHCICWTYTAFQPWPAHNTLRKILAQNWPAETASCFR